MYLEKNILSKRKKTRDCVTFSVDKEGPFCIIQLPIACPLIAKEKSGSSNSRNSLSFLARPFLPSKIYEYGIVAILSGPLFKEAVRVSNEGKGVIFSMVKKFPLPSPHSLTIRECLGWHREGGKGGEVRGGEKERKKIHRTNHGLIAKRRRQEGGRTEGSAVYFFARMSKRKGKFPRRRSLTKKF